MPRVALATWSRRMRHPDRENDLVVHALAAEGVDADLVVWNAPDPDWRRFDALVLRTPWDYTEDPAAFVAWTERAARVVPVWNPPHVVAWNADKRYLEELAERGVPVPPTVRVPRGSDADLAGILAREGWKRFVVKAAVDAGARRAMRGGPADVAAGNAHLAGILRDVDALVQPYLASIEREGEISLVYLGGRFSHAVRKTPASGDWRIQPQHGGAFAPAEPTAAERAVAERTLDVAPSPLLYARVDLVRLDDGAPALIELEVIEPFLFLESDPGAAARYARAVAGVLRGSGGVR